MKTKLIAIVLSAALALPLLARVEGYGPRRFTQVGHARGPHGAVVINRRVGPGWGGALAAGILGAAAGFAIGNAVAPPPVVVAAPMVGTMVPVLPGACVTVPSYNGSVVYNCGGIYYQPVYQGASLMYEVIPAP